MTETHPAMTRTPGNPLFDWWSTKVLSTVDHQDVLHRVQEDAGWNNHYAFMTLMSAGIAVLGLLLSSPAVVIGAMLISPLMGPIVGLGFAIATFDSAELRRTLFAVGVGVIVAIAFCALIVLVSPLQTVTDEIAARTRPNLFDLMVALFSGLAGSYAMIRGRQGAIVGVAIATSLMPPLATVGFGLATANWTVFWGASLLFFTNFMIIAIAAAIMARLYRFGHTLSPQQTRLQATALILIFLALAVPLGLSLKQIAWETLASRSAREVIAGHFGSEARLSDIAINYDGDPIAIDATVLTPSYRSGAERDTAAALQRLIGVPVQVTIDQFQVGAESDAEAAEIAAAKGLSDQRGRARVAERLALVAGVTPDQVLVDNVNNRAQVRAASLAGADLESYRALEQRVAAAERNWSVSLIPPAAQLPEIAFDGENPSEAGQAALATAIWAAERLQLPVGVAGSDAQAEIVMAAFSEAGVTVRRVEGEGGEGGAALRWLAPGEPEPQP